MGSRDEGVVSSDCISFCGARCGRVLFEIHRHRKSNITLRAIAKQPVVIVTTISVFNSCY